MTHCVFRLQGDNRYVLENYKYIFHFSYSVLTDQQQQVQAANKVYHELTFILLFLLLNWTIANSS